MTENKAGIIRGSVNGVNKYCRVPIQRRRTPICEKEIREMERLQSGFWADLETFGRVGCLLSDLGFPYFAGKVFSYIDMQNGREYAYIQFVEEDGSGAASSAGCSGLMNIQEGAGEVMEMPADAMEQEDGG